MRISWLFAALLLQAILISQSIFKVMPVSVGFFLRWAREASIRGLYTEFFYPFPPVSLWVEGNLPLMFPNPNVAEQWVQAAKWILIVAALFYLLVELKFTGLQAFIGVTMAGTAYFVSPGNITAGYLELAWLFLIVGTLCVVRSLSRVPYSQAVMAFGGISFALAALTKQTTMVVALVVALILLVIERRNLRHWNRAYVFVVGGLIPVLIIVGYAILQGTFTAAISNILGGGGKAPFSSSLPLFWLVEGFGFTSPRFALVVLGIGSLLIAIRGSRGGNRVRNPQTKTILLASGLIAICAGLIGINGLSALDSIPTIKSAELFVALIFVLVAATFFFEEFQLLKQLPTYVWSFVLVASGIAFILLGTKANSIDPEFAGWSGNYLISINLIGGIGAIGALFYALFHELNVRRGRAIPSRGILVASSVTIAFALGQVLSAGLGVEIWLLSLAVTFGAFAKLLSQAFSSSAAKMLVLIATLALLAPMAFAQSRVPYSWWGLAEDALYSNHAVSDRRELDGYELGTSSRSALETIGAGIDEIKQSESSPTLIGPNLAGLPGQVFPGLVTYELICPIPWYDLCPASLEAQDLKRLQESPPNSIIWAVAPQSVLDGHAKNFSSAQIFPFQEMQDWVLAQSTNGRYRVVSDSLIGATQSDPASMWRLLILVRNPVVGS